MVIIKKYKGKKFFNIFQKISRKIGINFCHCVCCTVYRYHSQGQIAATGYMNPMFVEGHWVVFDADTFGHVWIFLTSFSLYSRVTESFANQFPDDN